MIPLSPWRAAALAAALSLTACGMDPSAAERLSGGALDQLLRVNDLQCEGTHNSYHIQSWFPLPEYQYTHADLDEQADTEGVRKFELDLHYNPLKDRVDVFHVVVIDRRTTCDTLRSCLSLLKGWSDENRDHHPMFVLLEPKTLQPSADPAHFLELMEEDIQAVFPPDRILTPDYVQGSYATLPAALTVQGWPTLGETRGQFMFILHDTGELRDIYTWGGQSLHDRVMFVESSPGQPFAAFVILNDAIGSFSSIQSAVRAGYLVRTRADSGLKPDPESFQAALDSGAHIISTDFPDASENPSYWIEMPGGNPSRCNPLTAPDVCTAIDIENLR